MRQVFRSARLENVEAVAQLLEDAGIETRITHGRSFKGAIRGNFSYREEGEAKPGVWIVRSEDQPRARAMLREAGLMDSSRESPSSYRAMSFRGDLPDPHRRDARQRRAFRIKLGLLLVIAAVIALAFMSRTPSSPQAAEPGSAATPPPIGADTRALPARGTAPVPDALAVAVLRGDVPEDADEIVCIVVDGRDPPPAVLAALPRTGATVLPASRCPARGRGPLLPLILAVGRYESSDPSGAGTVYFVRRRGSGPVVPRWFEARPYEGDWRVVQPL